MLTNTRIFSAVLILITSVLACSVNIGGPDYPGEIIPASTEALGTMEGIIQQAMTNAATSGQLSFIINEVQMTSYVSNKLQGQTEPILTNPQVLLRDGQIQIYGTIQRGIVSATARVIIAAGVDPTGGLLIDIVEADFGPLPVPDQLKDIITAMISEAFTGSIGTLATSFRIETIVISEGIMAISGSMK